MPTRELLPGVTTDSCPPRVVCDAHQAIRKARRRALLKDIGQLTILVGVDWLFLRWPEARVPFLGRADSLAILRGVNALAVADLWLTRALPKWSAMRIASTWCRSEREKFQKR
ncbi:MAG TPA: hypothetical protein VHW00_22630 [Thermoanaerobaculia bacterium]|nr:hypothetical protein [Thermoanaerobaculia bacterium]